MYQPATENSPLFAVDCEMVSTVTLCGVIYALLFARSIFIIVAVVILILPVLFTTVQCYLHSWVAVKWTDSSRNTGVVVQNKVAHFLWITDSRCISLNIVDIVYCTKHTTFG